MKRALLITSLLLALPARAALPGDSAAGKKLHDTYCTSCHSTGVYTRRDRQIRSLEALTQQLTECTHAAQVTLTSDEQKSIVKYLNEQFYKFK
ncbi:MAG TPA: hypothetical protein VMH26_09700 [Burkholderiales bacterium]|nr:hypothetical protein [Burkholderiales bacterium]